MTEHLETQQDTEQVLHKYEDRRTVIIFIQDCISAKKVAGAFIRYGYDNFMEHCKATGNIRLIIMRSSSYSQYSVISNEEEYLTFFGELSMTDSDSPAIVAAVDIWYSNVLHRWADKHCILVTIGCNVVGHSVSLSMSLLHCHVVIPIGIARLPCMQASTNLSCRAIFPNHISDLPDMVARQIKTMLIELG